MKTRLAVAALSALLAVPITAGAQLHEGREAEPGGLRLSEVLAVAAQRNPRLHALGSAASAAAARAPEASTLPDPVFQIGIMNFGVPSLNADMPTSMAPSLQLTQNVPFPGKLSLRGEVADRGTTMAEAAAEEGAWEVRRDAAALFFDLYSLDRRLDVMRETLALLQDFQEVAQAMYGAGTGRQADVLRADVEVARMDGEIQRMESMRRAQAARLNALLDMPASTPVGTPLLGEPPLDVPSQDTLLAWARESRPLLEQSRLGVEQARLRGELARKAIWPDLMLGVSYGQRDRGLGTERMGSVMLGFSLPVHAGSRQYAARAEADAMEDMASADHRAVETSVDAQIGVLLAELDRARRLVALYRDEVITEAHATVESAFSSYRVGSVDFMTLVDAQMTVNRYEGELFQLLGEYGKAVSALESVIGRELPRTASVLREQR
jgi:outer membrane protein TolC